ncbi:hypothetical protein EV175_006788, partial [Coemansia sp. RSA 1933]
MTQQQQQQGQMARSESVAFRRNKRQGMTMSVVERYARNDIPCALAGCTRCAQNHELRRRGVPLLSTQAPRILVPDASTVSRYIELLETGAPGELDNIVFCQTVLDALDRRNRSRTIRNVRRIAADPRRSSVVFANTVFSETLPPPESAVQMPSGQAVAERDMRAVLRTAN